jgi:hypothetical protein
MLSSPRPGRTGRTGSLYVFYLSEQILLSQSRIRTFFLQHACLLRGVPLPGLESKDPKETRIKTQGTSRGCGRRETVRGGRFDRRGSDMNRKDPAPDAGLDQDLEDRLSGSLSDDPMEDDWSETDPDYEAWLDARAEELEEARYELSEFAGGSW